ncbi:hypothetical protein K7432_005769 [Basidiobolus ranarum]|uniref:CLASP N-terminal domain-containing protein n=1 Tax=Basidiobolus ranarum TaxID=34480 RepID=A0ABR2W3I5_9FUNG
MPGTTPNKSVDFAKVLDEAANILKSTPENEDTWSLLNETIRELDDFTKSDIIPENFSNLIQVFSNDIAALLTSQKSILVATILDFVKTLGINLSSDDFLVLEEQFVPEILKLIQRDARIFQLRARECIVTLVQHKKLLTFFPAVVEGFAEGNEFAKCNIMEILVEYVQCLQIDMEPYLESLESVLRVGCADSSQDVREITRRVYDAYRKQFKERAEILKDALSEESKNNLKIESPSLPSLSEESDCDSEHVIELSPTPLRSTTPQNRMIPLDLTKSTSKYLSKDSPLSTSSLSSRTSKLTIPCDDLPYMKSTRAHHHRLSQNSLAPEFGLKSWETSGANIDIFPMTLRIYPVPEGLPDRKPFRV